MNLAEQAVKHLDDLGSTSDEIAGALVKLGVKGYRHDSRSCPCGTYLRNKLNREVYVYKNKIIVYDKNAFGQSDIYEHKTSPAVHDLVIGFDGSQYPDLIDETKDDVLENLID